MKRILTAVLAGVIVASVCMTMASCGGSKESSKASTTAPTTTAPATTAAATTVAASAQASAQASGEVSNALQSSIANQGSEYYQPATNYQGGNIPEDKVYGGVWEQVAIQNALSVAGDQEAIVVGDYPGYAPDGLECWVVTVKKSDGTYAVYYSGFQFCYPDTSGNANTNNESSSQGGNTGSQTNNGSVYADPEDEDNTVAPYQGN